LSPVNGHLKWFVQIFRQFATSTIASHRNWLVAATWSMSFHQISAPANFGINFVAASRTYHHAFRTISIFIHGHLIEQIHSLAVLGS